MVVNPNSLTVEEVILLADAGVCVEINNGEIKLVMEV